MAEGAEDGLLELGAVEGVVEVRGPGGLPRDVVEDGDSEVGGAGGVTVTGRGGGVVVTVVTPSVEGVEGVEGVAGVEGVGCVGGVRV